MTTLVTLFARFGISNYPHSLEFYLEKLQSDFPDFVHHVYVIDSDPSVTLPNPKFMHRCFLTFVRGGNSVGEFSCWQKGSDEILIRYNQNTPVLIVNSAFEAGFNEYLTYLNQEILTELNVPLFLVGHLEYLFEKLQVSETENLEFWLRSSFVVSNVRTILRIKQLVHTLDESQLNFIKGIEDHETVQSQDYIQYLRDWITGKMGKHNVKWHSKLELHPKNYPDIERKSNSIWSEHRLTLDALRSGVLILDAAHWSKTRDLKTPWLLQLQNRPYGTEAYRRFAANLTDSKK